VNRCQDKQAIKITEDSPTCPDADYCLRQYYRELQRRFEDGFDPDYEVAPSLDEFEPPDGAFLLMRIDDEPVGCGGLKKLDGHGAYLKRMWVSPQRRGLGLGKALLEGLEMKARLMGYDTVCLETHKSLIEAQRLYSSCGYVEVEPFNDEPYAHHWYKKAMG
jgi:GNAT superfamily N-acetyltransferase